jgi:hypothetical protein
MGFVPQYSFDVNASNGLSSVLVPVLVLGMADTGQVKYFIVFKLGHSAWTGPNGYANSGIKKPDFLQKIGPLNVVYRVN